MTTHYGYFVSVHYFFNTARRISLINYTFNGKYMFLHKYIFD